MSILTNRELDDTITRGWIMFDTLGKKPGDHTVKLHDGENKVYYDTLNGWKKKISNWSKIIPITDSQHALDRRALFDFNQSGMTTIYFFSLVWRRPILPFELKDPEWELRGMAAFDDSGGSFESSEYYIFNDAEIEMGSCRDEFLRYIKDTNTEEDISWECINADMNSLNKWDIFTVEGLSLSLGINSHMHYFEKKIKSERVSKRLNKYQKLGVDDLENILWIMDARANMSTLDWGIIYSLLENKSYRAAEDFIREKKLQIMDKQHPISLNLKSMDIPNTFIRLGRLRMLEQLAFLHAEIMKTDNVAAEKLYDYITAYEEMSENIYLVDDFSVDIAALYGEVRNGKPIGEALEARMEPIERASKTA